MKRILILSVLLMALNFLSFSQTDSLMMRRMATLGNEILFQQSNIAKPKTRVIKQRLILDTVFYRPTSFTNPLQFKRNDVFHYSGTRGSEQRFYKEVGYQFIKNIDSGCAFGIINTSPFQYKYYYLYNNNNQPTQSILLQYNYISNAWEIYSHTEKIYTNNLLSVVHDWDNGLSTGNPIFKSYFSYTNNLLTEILMTKWNGSNYDSVGKTSYFYNGQNISKIQTKVWNINSSAWLNQEEENFFYNANNLVISYIDSIFWNASTNSYTSYGITKSYYDNLYRIDSASKSNDGIGDRNMKMYYIGNSSNYNKIVTYGIQDNSILTSNFIFDSNDNLIKEEHTPNKIGIVVNDSITNATHYYFEDYNNGIPALNNNIDNTSNINVFPNPSKEQIYISYQTNQIMKSNISICDITGKTIFNFVENENIGNHLIKIPLYNFNSGTYFISISNSKNSIFSKFSVLK